MNKYNRSRQFKTIVINQDNLRKMFWIAIDQDNCKWPRQIVNGPRQFFWIINGSRVQDLKATKKYFSASNINLHVKFVKFYFSPLISFWFQSKFEISPL